MLSQLQRSIPNINPSNLPSGRVPDMSQPSDVRGALDHIYNPAQPRGNLSRNMQTLHRQTTTRAALEASEISIARADKRFAELSELTNEIDSTKTIKEAADMTNKLLIKILMAIDALTDIQAQFTRMEAAKNYTGLPANPEFKPQELSTGERWGQAASHQEGALPKRCSRGMREAGFCN